MSSSRRSIPGITLVLGLSLCSGHPAAESLLTSKNQGKQIYLSRFSRSILNVNKLKLRGGYDTGGVYDVIPENEMMIPDDNGGPSHVDGIFTLCTPKHSHVSYYGIMFNVRAKTSAVFITGLKIATTSPKSPFIYRTYTSPYSWRQIRDQRQYWTEIGAAKIQAPYFAGHYAHVPMNQAVPIQPGNVQAFFIHCPQSAEGVAYRDDCDVSEEDGVTDADEHIELTMGGPSFSLVPFEDVEDVPRAFAGVVEYCLAEA